MCAIFGSSDKDKFLELAKLNEYRGSTAWSCTIFTACKFKHYYEGINLVSSETVEKNHFSMDMLIDLSATINEYESVTKNDSGEVTYYLGHTQTPTTQSLEHHPSVYGEDYLWHNGIIKESQREIWKKQYGEVEWDTDLLHRHLILNGSLSDVDGTFSCVRYRNKQLKVFRNEISPLFFDKELNISSVEFEDSKETESGFVYELDIQSKTLEKQNHFKTKENPYYFG